MTRLPPDPSRAPLTPDELLAAYAHRPGDLTADERRQVEALLASPAAAAALADTRALIARVAELPARGTEPVWDDLARSIRVACGAPPAAWWARWLPVWKPALGALAVAAAVLALWLVRREPAPITAAVPADARPASRGTGGDDRPDAIDDELDDPLDDAVAIGDPMDPLDEIDLDAIDDELDDDIDEVDGADRLAADLGSLDWIDQLDDDELDALSRWLDTQGAG